MLVPSGSVGVLVGCRGRLKGLEDGYVCLGRRVTINDDESVANLSYMLRNQASGWRISVVEGIIRDAQSAIVFVLFDRS